MRIDPHVHLRDGAQRHKETIAHGLETARRQGVDVVFDMPNTSPPVLRPADVDARLALVPEGSEGRYRLYIGATADQEQLAQAASLVASHPAVIGIKMFAGKSTGDLAIVDEDGQRGVYRALARAGYRGVLAVHCEKESCMSDTFDPADPPSHCRARPKRAEIESVKDQLAFAREAGFAGTLHVCHVSCAESIGLIERARGEGLGFGITCGATPHHLLWDESRMGSELGAVFKINPPLRSREDMLALRACLVRGSIDWIETDHAPHTIGEKLHDGHPSGYPSLYLYRELVEQALPSWGIGEERIAELTYGNIVKAFGEKAGGRDGV